jgi:hypothetical protein
MPAIWDRPRCFIRLFSVLLLRTKGSFTGPNKNGGKKAIHRLNTIFQENEYFCLTCSCFRTLKHTTMDPHQEQMGAGFLSLKVEVPATWLGEGEILKKAQ